MLVDDSSLGLTFAEDIFIGKEPARAGNTVTIFDTPGFPDQLNFDRTEIYKHPSIQIRVRNTSYQEGWALANDIISSLHGRGQETWNGTLYTLIRSMGEPALLDWDENNRCRFIVNFDIQRR